MRRSSKKTPSSAKYVTKVRPPSVPECPPREYCTALMALHAFTGCDSTSAFKGVGKIKPIKTMQKMPKYQPLLAKLGDSWEVSEDLVKDLEEFTCAMYGKPRFTNIDDLRYTILKGKCDVEGKLDPSNNVDMGSLPPCGKSLLQHIRRVNYQVGIWKRAYIAEPEIPNPADGHGWVMVDGRLEPMWCEGDILPRQLTSILESVVQSEEEDDSDSDVEDSVPIPSDDSMESD